jgi:hypothetical protein
LLPQQRLYWDPLNRLQIPNPGQYQIQWIRPLTALVRHVESQESCVVDVSDLEFHGSCTCSDFLFRMQPVITNPAGLRTGMAWGCKHLRLIWWLQRLQKPYAPMTRHTPLTVPLPLELQKLL